MDVRESMVKGVAKGFEDRIDGLTPFLNVVVRGVEKAVSKWLDENTEEVLPTIKKQQPEVKVTMEQTVDACKDCDDNYWRIVKERDRRLKASRETGDYEFTVAHGLTDALRIIDKVFPFSKSEEL
jgi:hypothetical protein